MRVRIWKGCAGTRRIVHGHDAGISRQFWNGRSIPGDQASFLRIVRLFLGIPRRFLRIARRFPGVGRRLRGVGHRSRRIPGPFSLPAEPVANSGRNLGGNRRGHTDPHGRWPVCGARGGGGSFGLARELVRCRGVLSVVRQAAADGSRMGASGAWHGRTAVSVGQRRARSRFAQHAVQRLRIRHWYGARGPVSRQREPLRLL